MELHHQSNTSELEKLLSGKSTLELMSEMELAEYENEEARRVSGVLSASEQTILAIEEWCEARLESGGGEIEKKSTRNIVSREYT